MSDLFTPAPCKCGQHQLRKPKDWIATPAGVHTRERCGLFLSIEATGHQGPECEGIECDCSSLSVEWPDTGWQVVYGSFP